MKILYVTRHFNHSGYIILDALIREKFNIAAVLLHRDNNKWRSRFFRIFLLMSYRFKCWYYRCRPLKTVQSEEFLAKRHNIPIIWDKSIKSDSIYKALQDLNPDIIVLGGGWHELIPKRVFSFARLGCINTHPSLLPEFRGTSITRWQVYHGVTRSGSTIHYVDDTFDTGGILAQAECEVGHRSSPQELFFKLGEVGADIMVPLLRDFEQNGRKQPYFVEHNPEFYHYYKRWQWDEKTLAINWSWPLRKIHFHILGNTQESYEYLGPVLEHDNQRYFVRESDLVGLDEASAAHASRLHDGELHVLDVKDDAIWLIKKGCPFALVLISLQEYDSHYKYRRSQRANKLLRVNKGELFKKC
jgi:methionyl-tRNA formyltransferase